LSPKLLDFHTLTYGRWLILDFSSECGTGDGYESPKNEPIKKARKVHRFVRSVTSRCDGCHGVLVPRLTILSR
jgi:hypothetical protein